ncbi:hypothetical protein BTVI_60732 [Pitangus sulphuratus]|nr:hypothetical protein BTVI_60732 [Pitangus sulphuratus]
MLVPLRQVITPTGTQAKVKAPFSASNLNNWREEAKCFRENPEKVIKRFELIAKNQEIDWTDIDLMLSELTETEKEFVIKTARREVVSQIVTGVLTGDVDPIFPLQQPNWDPNNPDHYRMLMKYRDLIKVGLQNAIPKVVNWAALYDMRQGQKETPTEFLDRLRAAMRKYTTLDPSSEEALSLAMSCIEPKPNNEDIDQITNQVYPLVWATDTPGWDTRENGRGTGRETLSSATWWGENGRMTGRGGLSSGAWQDRCTHATAQSPCGCNSAEARGPNGCPSMTTT